MSPREPQRSRAASAPATGALARLRLAYLRLPVGVRVASLCVLAIGSGLLAATLGWPFLPTVALVALGFVVFAVAMARPRVAASGLVLVAWFFALPLMSEAYGGGSVQGTGLTLPVGKTGSLTSELAALALLGILVVGAAHLVGGPAPWMTALTALAAAGIVGSLLAVVIPAAGVIPAYVLACAALAYRALSRYRHRGRRPVGPADRAVQSPGFTRSPESSGPPRTAAAAGATHQPAAHDTPVEEISAEGALAELDAMIGLEPVKRQVHAVASSIEAARVRAAAGYQTEKPMRHFVFVGPPGTGKTMVARCVARVFYGFGLLDEPRLVEAQRADLVGEYLGATAVKTNQLVDSALGGVLFVDEAYGLTARGGADGGDGGGGDKFGAEAVQTLLKRAEDDRDRVVIILAGYEREMEDFLASNPGLNSRFATRVRFPSYDAGELVRIAEHHAAGRGERLDDEALSALEPLFEDVCRRGVVDELGNGRFVRSLVEAACTARDVRVVEAHGTAEAAPGPVTELVTLRRADVEQGYAEVTARLRGHADAPSLEEAFAELDGMIGLEPVKRQVRAISAQLRVGRTRREQGIVTAPPMRHFVFAGPPGTGKTTVARILGRVFAALGLLARPDVVEATRVDLVGEYLGQTAMKTNRLVDKALGGALFIDEAYSLAGEGYSNGDAFGSEAIATLLKRAEDDRDKLVIVLAGYPEDMARLLTRNQGLASRFTTRVTFPSYSQEELREVACRLAAASGDFWNEAALRELDGLFAHVSREGLTDQLGNGRFARSVYEQASAARDLRLSDRADDATPDELTTLTGEDVSAASAELIKNRPDGRAWLV